MTAEIVEDHSTRQPVDWLGVGAYLTISFGGAWLVALPLWMSPNGIADWKAAILLPLMMFTPTLATLAVVFGIRREPGKVKNLGLGIGAPGWWKYWAFAWIVIPGFCLIAPFVAALFGYYTLDLREFSGFRELLEKNAGSAALQHMSIQAIVISQLVLIPIAPLLNAPFAFGEEFGWRGYLLPKLLPLGQWPALILSGVIWGLWHAPVILLGYNYPKHPVGGVFIMTVMCIIIGVLFGWTRLASGSVWPSVIGHGALNGTAGIVFLLHKAGTEFNSAFVGLTGWTGWLLPIAWIIGLVLLGKLPAPEREVSSTLRPQTEPVEPPPPPPI